MAKKLIAHVRVSWHTDITDHRRQAFITDTADDVRLFSVRDRGLVVDGGISAVA